MTSLYLIVIFLPITNTRTNNQITALELRVVDELGGNLGTMSRDAALKLAKEKGLDLIEIAAGAKPPVARIMSYDKFRYQQEKKEKKQRAMQKGQEMKQIQISFKEALHDMQIKAGRLNKFLSEGNIVEVMLVLRGREKAHKDFARNKIMDFIKLINPEHRVIMEPRFAGKGMLFHVAKK